MTSFRLNLLIMTVDLTVTILGRRKIAKQIEIEKHIWILCSITFKSHRYFCLIFVPVSSAWSGLGVVTRPGVPPPSPRCVMTSDQPRWAWLHSVHCVNTNPRHQVPWSIIVIVWIFDNDVMPEPTVTVVSEYDGGGEMPGRTEGVHNTVKV